MTTPTRQAGRVRLGQVADAEALARVDVAAWRETYPGIVPQFFLDRIPLAKRHRYWEATLRNAGGRAAPTSTAFVAEIPGRGIVGFGACGEDRVGLIPNIIGEIHALYLLQAAQGMGLGRRLMAAMAALLTQRGPGPISVWALKDNTRARGFYEHLGGQLRSWRPLEFDGVVLTEVAYVWSNPSQLITKSEPE